MNWTGWSRCEGKFVVVHVHLRSIISIIKQKGWNLENENLHLKLMSRIYYLLQLSTSDGVHKWSPLLHIVEVHVHIAPSPKASVLRGSEKNCWKVPSTSKNIQYRLSNLGGFKMNYKKKFVGKERVTKNTCITEPYETQKRVAPKT